MKLTHRNHKSESIYVIRVITILLFIFLQISCVRPLTEPQVSGADRSENNSNTSTMANNISPAAFNEDTESIITLSYTEPSGGLATSCSITGETNVTVTSACSCDANGVCTVGVTGTSNYSGSASFKYNVTTTTTVTEDNTTTTTVRTTDDATANLTIIEVADAPIISTIPDQSVKENEPTDEISFTITDADTSLACNSSFIKYSISNTSLIDTSGIALSGTAPNCTLILTPKTSQTGSSIITVNLDDGGIVVTDTFTGRIS